MLSHIKCMHKTLFYLNLVIKYNVMCIGNYQNLFLSSSIKVLRIEIYDCMMGCVAERPLEGQDWSLG